MTQDQPSEREIQIHIENLRLLQQSRLIDLQQALDSCIKMNAATRKAFTDIIKLGNQVDVKYYDDFVAIIKSSDRLIDYLSHCQSALIQEGQHDIS